MLEYQNLEKLNQIDQNEENIYQLNYTNDSNRFLLYEKVHTPLMKNNFNSDELTLKLQKQRDKIENQINSTINETGASMKVINSMSLPTTSSELTTSSSTTSSTSSNASNTDLIDQKSASAVKQKPPLLKPKPRLPNNPHEPSAARSPSTSVTDISTSNLTSQNQDNDKYVTLTRNGTLSRMSQRPTHAPPIPSLVSQTTTFYPYISTNYDYAVVNLNQFSDTLKKQNKIKQSDC
jgi:hypothetical protein